MDKEKRAVNLIKVFGYIEKSGQEKYELDQRETNLKAELERVKEEKKKLKQRKANTLAIFKDDLVFSAKEILSAYAFINKKSVSRFYICCTSEQGLNFPGGADGEITTDDFNNLVECRVCVRNDGENARHESAFPYLNYHFEADESLLGASKQKCFNVVCNRNKCRTAGYYFTDSYHLEMKPEYINNLKIKIDPKQVEDMPLEFVNALITVSMYNPGPKKKKNNPRVE